MLAAIFKRSPVIDDNSRAWMFDTFAWAIEHLGTDFFTKESKLVLPTNEFYPGKVSSIHEMASSIFAKTVEYAGMTKWPLRLVEPQYFHQNQLPSVKVSQEIRGKEAQVFVQDESHQFFDVSYIPSQVNQPQDLISYFVQVLATILATNQPIPPPGGKESLNQSIDLVACYMGFGVIFSNTAYQFRGGCGSCNNPRLNRQSSLAEQETIYALAIFAYLKRIPAKEVTPHIKSHLRSTFKRSLKDIAQFANTQKFLTIN